MEPANIDWTSIESKYVHDELYEHIDAPKWLDLSVPIPPVDDEAWFCRPDCRHPKTAKDFQRWTSPSPKAKPTRVNVEPPMPLGERNSKNESLKRRGGNAKNFREDLENQNPNFPSNTSTNPSRPVNVLKEAVKPSAVKRGAEEEEMGSKKPVPRLSSTLSARNLFSGSDILLGQISEFCNEIKKMAVGRERTSPAQGEAKEDKKLLLETPSKKSNGLAKKSCRLTVKVGSEEENYNKDGGGNSSVLREVRACPPTPQRFPSPSSCRLRSIKPVAITSSPLNNKPPKSSPPGRGILQDLDKICEEERKLVAKDENCVRTSIASDTEGSSVDDMFWFFKPCTYLVK